MKALGRGIGALSMRDVEVVRAAGTGASRAPTLRLSTARLPWLRRAGVHRWHVSLTHTDGVALAMVVAEGVP